MMHTSVDPNEVVKFSQYAEDWWAPHGALHTLHDINPVRLTYIQSFVSLKGTRVLDIGCGGGILSEGLAKSGAIVTGLDVEPAAIAVAKQHASQVGLSIDYVCQPLEEYQATLYPMMTCLEMLEHVSRPEMIVEHAARLLAPGGYLILSTINRTPKAYASVILAAEYVLGLIPKQTHDYQRFLKPSELANMARAVDLDVIDIKGLAYHPLARSATLTASVDMNYLMVCRAYRS
jgi:2-polyprenyl-6-hydroxyphenyl methylase/3-demethylubiquinone-9 3-methyltransferase